MVGEKLPSRASLNRRLISDCVMRKDWESGRIIHKRFSGLRRPQTKVLLMVNTNWARCMRTGKGCRETWRWPKNSSAPLLRKDIGRRQGAGLPPVTLTEKRWMKALIPNSQPCRRQKPIALLQPQLVVPRKPQKLWLCVIFVILFSNDTSLAELPSPAISGFPHRWRDGLKHDYGREGLCV